MLKKTVYLVSLSSLLLLVNGCSSIWGVHTYNEEFGLLENEEANQQLEQEELANQEEIQKYYNELNNGVEFQPEEGTFLAEDWVQPQPKITYKYDGDPNFYSEDELPANKARLGNVIVKVPSSMSKEEVLSELGGV